MTDIDYEPLPTSARYAVRLGADGKPHMYDYTGRTTSFYVPEQAETWREKSYDGGTVYFDTRVFRDWLQRPREITDTFEMFGRGWIVIEPQDMYIRRLKCVPETPFSHSLALYMLNWYLEIDLWQIGTLRSLYEQLPWTGDVWL